MTIEFTLAAAEAIFGKGSGFIVHANGNEEGKPPGAWLETCDPSPGVGAAENEVLLWHPLGAIYEPGGPDPQENPSLPIPFTSRQLAACFLHGMGSILAIRFGDWTDGPDEDALKNLLQGSPAAQAAVRAAFDAYRQALSVVDKGPLNAARKQADELHITARSIENGPQDSLSSVKLNQAYKAHAVALAEAGLKEELWLRGMVQQLLQGNAALQQGPAKAPPNKTGKLAKKVGWRELVWPYLIKELQAGTFASAKELFKHIENMAGTQGSPFSKGTGNHREKLIVNGPSQPVSLKTLQNDWKGLKVKAAHKVQ